MGRAALKRTLVTGANGFIGRNLVAALEQLPNVSVLKFGVENTCDQLRAFVAEADFVFHLAGINRPRNVQDFDSGNRGLTEELLAMLRAAERPTPVLLSSSIQAALDNPYGVSKRASEEAVALYASECGADVYVYRLPNVFGKWCRPNYNSVVATWCHHIAHDLPIQVNNPEAELHLVYIDDVVAEFLAAWRGEPHRDADGYCFVPRTYRLNLRQLAETLRGFRASRETLLMPNLSGELEPALYATYLSHLPADAFSYPLNRRTDNRGWLAEFIKSGQFGQVFVSRTKPGVTRGNHWHHTKVEKFLVVEGQASIKLRHLVTGQTVEYPVSGEELRVVDIPPGYTHSITNTGSGDLLTLFWADEVFDPARPDTFFLEV